MLGTADALLTQNPDLSAVDYELEPGPTYWDAGWTSEGLGTPFEISLSLQKENFANLFLDKGRMDINRISSQGVSVLGSIFQYSGLSTQFQCRAVSLLLSRGADPNLSQVYRTPLQLAVSRNHLNIPAVEMLLNANANVNAIADDDVVVRHLRKIYDDDSDDELLRKEIYGRGKGKEYDTPLRIVKNKLDQAKREGSSSSRDNLEDLAELVRLLEERGAKSFHLFPIKDLPGYVEEDIIAFHDSAPKHD